MVSNGPFSEILKERKRKSRQSALHAFFQKKENPQPGAYQKVKSLHYSMVEKKSM
jgi:hypothetical protein